MHNTLFWPNDAKLIEIENTTVPFYGYMQDGKHVIGFDTSSCVPPEPMINAMIALEKLTDETIQIVMINHRSPVGLLAKVGNFYDIVIEDLGDSKQKLTFSYKAGESEKADLSKKNCAG
ncbi:MAG: hypothetical protein PHN18_05645 [Sulfurospirillaceae bacterium]|jgi:hypothetical protein|nr:hypothetical protein [Sulfurospirillaceae bacterium]MDD2825794.1 hypothetical protein [Sulfurospirillaceae bacterium]